jgi:hypothetical protein
MVKTISRWQGLYEIIILDNGSTYGPLLDWYETLEDPTRVVRLCNLGHTAADEVGRVLEDVARLPSSAPRTNGACGGRVDSGVPLQR